MELKGKKINVLGDSITQGYGTSSEQKIFWNLLSEDTGSIVRGYGIGGTRIARQRNPSPTEEWDHQDFCSRVEGLDPDADIVLVFGATNDFGHGDVPLGNMTDRTPDTFYGAVHTLCRSLLERFPVAQIVLMTPLHRQNEDAIINDVGVRSCSDLEGYVSIILKVAAYYGLPVLDLCHTSGLQPKVDAIRDLYFLPDGLHPNDVGHRRIADKLISFLKAL